MRGPMGLLPPGSQGRKHAMNPARFLRPAATAATSAILLTTVGLVAVPPASAARTDCSSGYYCAWKDADYLNTFRQAQYDNADWHSNTYLSPLADEMSSHYCNGNFEDCRVWSNTSARGDSLTLQRGSSDNWVGNNGTASGQSFNDRLSSNYWGQY
jgi:hypothetical protein